MDRKIKVCLAILVSLFIALLVWGAFAPAYAQQTPQNCGPRRDVIDMLKRKYGEEERWFSVQSSEKATVLVLMVGKNGSWTLLKAMPDMACGIASGTDSNLILGTPA